MTLPWSLLLIANGVVVVLILALLVLYVTLYYPWKTPAGRSLCIGLVAALLVTSGGVSERLGDTELHDWLVALGYTVACVVLTLTIRYVLRRRRQDPRRALPPLPDPRSTSRR